MVVVTKALFIDQQLTNCGQTTKRRARHNRKTPLVVTSAQG